MIANKVLTTDKVLITDQMMVSDKMMISHKVMIADQMMTTDKVRKYPRRDTMSSEHAGPEAARLPRNLKSDVAAAKEELDHRLSFGCVHFLLKNCNTLPKKGIH